MDDPRRACQLVEYGAILKCRWLHLPSGDQAMLIEFEAVYAMRCLPNWPLQEDFDCAKPLRRKGPIMIAS
jgi:hypothetical protein